MFTFRKYFICLFFYLQENLVIIKLCTISCLVNSKRIFIICLDMNENVNGDNYLYFKWSVICFLQRRRATLNLLCTQILHRESPTWVCSLLPTFVNIKEWWGGQYDSMSLYQVMSLIYVLKCVLLSYRNLLTSPAREEEWYLCDQHFRTNINLPDFPWNCRCHKNKYSL